MSTRTRGRKIVGWLTGIVGAGNLAVTGIAAGFLYTGTSTTDDRRNVILVLDRSRPARASQLRARRSVAGCTKGRPNVSDRRSS